MYKRQLYNRIRVWDERVGDARSFVYVGVIRLATGKKPNTVELATRLILPVLEDLNIQLWDVRFEKEGTLWYLRYFIDKDGGVDINDCETVSRRMNDLLDEYDYIEDSYIFEVSSPGLGRPLKKEKDYARSMGKELEIRTYRAIHKEKEFYGILTAYDADTVTIKTEDETEVTFAKADIALIRLAFDF